MRVNSSRPPLLFALFWIVFGTFITGTFMVMSLVTLYRNLLPYTWQTAEGVLLESGSEYLSDGDHMLKVRYRYTVNGRQFESTRYDPDFLADGGSRDRVRKTLAELRQQQPLRVRYNPSAPAESVLRFNPHKIYLPLTWGIGFFLVMIVGIGGGMLLAENSRWKDTIGLCSDIGASLILTGLSGFVTAFLPVPGGVWQWVLSLAGVGYAVHLHRKTSQEAPSAASGKRNRDASASASRPRGLTSVKTMHEGMGCGLFMAVFGLPFAYFGGQGFLQGGGSPGAFIALGFGLMLVWGGLSQAWMHSRAQKPQASTSPETVTPGRPFTFRFSQRFRRATRVSSVDAFLCWRELVRYYDGSEMTTKEVDRLVAQVRQEGQTYQGGQTLTLTADWTLPPHPMGLRHPYKDKEQLSVEAQWIVKVRVSMGKGQDIWEEYALSVAEAGNESFSATESGSATGYDLFLTGTQPLKMLTVMNVMSELLSHLRPDQVGDLHTARPSLLLENVPQAEAEQAKAKLEAVGAEIALRPHSIPVDAEETETRA